MENKEKYNQLLLSMSTFYAFNNKVKNSKELQALLDKYIKINLIDIQEDDMKVMWKYSDPEEDQEGEKIIGLSQLEVIPKKLMLVLDKEGEQLDEILIICTEETEKNISFTPRKKENTENSNDCTANDNNNSEQIITSNISSTKFFEERIKEWCRLKEYHIPKFNPLVIKEESIVTGKGLQEIVTEIRDKNKVKGYSLWIDTHGGLRNIQFIMNAVIYLLKDEEIEPKEIYGIEADNNNNKGEITSENQKYQLFTFMAGMNEFINFGSAARLKDFFDKTETDDSTRILLDCIARISEAIQLCNMTKFSKEVENLKIYFKKKKSEDSKSSSIIEIFIDRIYNEYKNLFDDNSCENQIRWCINKNFIQQALTLVEAWMPKEIVNAGLLREQASNRMVIDILESDKEKSIKNHIVEFVAKKIYYKGFLNYKEEKVLDLYIMIEKKKYYFNIFVFDNIENHKNILEYFLFLHYTLKKQRNIANHALVRKSVVNEVDIITFQIKDYLKLFDLLKKTKMDKEIKSIDIEGYLLDKKLWEYWQTNKRNKKTREKRV